MTQPTAVITKARLDAFCTRVSRMFAECVILLCGSAAVGENMPWSDVDLVVIADFDKPFLDRTKELALLDDTGLGLEVLCYRPDEFMQMMDRLNPAAIEAAEFGIPIVSGNFIQELKRKLAELKKLGLTKTQCTYYLSSRQR